MATYLRILNRGSFPRKLLEYIGAGTTRATVDNHAQRGGFQSGTKFAPVAALRLGIGINVTSHDEDGRYFVSYGTMPERAGSVVFDRIILRYDQGTDVDTKQTTEAHPKWSAAIGDDPMRSFPVLREYVHNAVNADPGRFAVEPVEELFYAPTGHTCVYLTETQEFRAILAAPDRYFKFLSKAKPVFEGWEAAVAGDAVVRRRIGEIFPKSEPGVTRLFSRGTLAYCSKDAVFTKTLYDYSLDRFELLSEERTFNSLDAVYRELNLLFRQWQDVSAIAGLIEHVVDETWSLENSALERIGDGEPVPAAESWRKAWHRALGPKAVLSSRADLDERARHSRKVEPIAVPSGLRKFLKRCGVPEAKDLVADLTNQAQYRLITPNPEECARLVEALRILHWEFPETKDWPLGVYEPLTEQMRSTLGFTLLSKDGKPPSIAIARQNLGDLPNLLHVLVHEFRHGRTNVNDENRKFVDQADKDLVRLLMQKYGLDPAT